MKIKFETQYDLNRFNSALNIKLNTNSKKLYYPSLLIESKKLKRFRTNKSFDWNEYWIDMPHFTKEEGWYHCIDLIISEEHIEEFESKIDFKFPASKKIQSFWYGDRHHRYKGKYFTSDNELLKNKYPIYIPSKGRWNCCKTADTLLELGVDNFLIIVEPQEYEKYAEVYDEKYLLELDMTYIDNYETLDNLGLSKSTGPGAARNFAWDHSIKRGYDWHHVWDDNIHGYVRFAPGNFRIPIKSPVFLNAYENFVTRFSNVSMGSLNYRFFCVSNRPAFQVNTRMYSIILIRNEIPFRWRGRYNEDTIISIDVMEAGWKTLMLNSFLANKAATQTTKGGNNKDFYQKEGTTAKSQMLKDVYPQYTELVERWGRPHHFIDYKKYWPDHTLDYEIWFHSEKYNKINEYGLYLNQNKVCLI